MPGTGIDDTIAWLLDADPAIRWQVMRDLLDAPEAEWQAERAKVEREGWGARLLALQDADGQWAGGAFWPSDFSEAEFRQSGQAWTATCWSLAQLREFGLPGGCGCARRTVDLVRRHSRWEHDGQPYWDGEVEECINGRTVADGAWLGADVAPIVRRLLGESQPDGGWNCERASGSRVSSFDTTINVIEGLLEYERRTGPDAAVRAARHGGEGYLLARRLFRGLRSGDVADERFLQLAHPNRWSYDVLRALDHFRAAALFDGTAPDPRLAEAIAQLRARQTPDGRWLLERVHRGRSWFAMEAPGEPSRWLTLRALRVMKWWEG